MVDMGREEGLTQTSVGDALEACRLKEEVSPGLSVWQSRTTCGYVAFRMEIKIK